MKKLSLSLALWLALAGLVSAYEWRPIPHQEHCYALFEGQLQLGGYDSRQGVYLPFDSFSKTWGQPCVPPYPPPRILADLPGVTQEVDPLTGRRILNAGITTSAISQEGERIRRNGKPVDAASARQLLQGRLPQTNSGTPQAPSPELPQDKEKPWLTFVGDDAGKAKFLGDLQSPDCAALRANFRVQTYSPTDVMTRDRDSKPCYATGVTVTSAPGIAVLHQDAYASAAELSQSLTEGLRRCGPRYDPSRIPGPKRLPVNPLKRLPVPADLAVLGVGAFALLIPLAFRRPKR